MFPKIENKDVLAAIKVMTNPDKFLKKPDMSYNEYIKKYFKHRGYKRCHG